MDSSPWMSLKGLLFMVYCRQWIHHPEWVWKVYCLWFIAGNGFITLNEFERFIVYGLLQVMDSSPWMSLRGLLFMVYCRQWIHHPEWVWKVYCLWFIAGNGFITLNEFERFIVYGLLQAMDSSPWMSLKGLLFMVYCRQWIHHPEWVWEVYWRTWSQNDERGSRPGFQGKTWAFHQTVTWCMFFLCVSQAFSQTLPEVQEILTMSVNSKWSFTMVVYENFNIAEVKS